MIAFAPDILPLQAMQNKKAEKAAGYISLIAIKNQPNIATKPLHFMDGMAEPAREFLYTQKKDSKEPSMVL